MEAANGFLEEVYLPRHNACFARTPEDAGSAFVPFAGNLEDILCIQEERVVGNDCRYGTRSVNTVRDKNRTLQIPADRHRHHDVKATVRVHEYPEGGLAVFHGPRRLATCSADGSLVDGSDRQAAQNRFDAAKGLWIYGQRCSVAHNPTGPTTATEAVNPYGT